MSTHFAGTAREDLMAGNPSKDPRSEAERLRFEVEELRPRLEEAEQALEAIRTGQVESLIVEGPNGPRILSLEGADHSYRVLVEAMNEGAATLSEDGTILYCNARFAQMLDAEIERVMGGMIACFLPERSRNGFEALLRAADGHESRGELELLGHNGQVVPAYLSVSVISDGESHRFCLVATDLRAQKRSDEIVAAERLARSVLDQAAEAIIVCDEQGRVIRASSAASDLCGCNPLLRTFDEAFTLDFAAAQGAGADPHNVRPGRLAAEVLNGKVLWATPATLRHSDGSQADVLVSATALRGAEDKTIGCVVNLVEITDLSRARQALAESETRFRSVLDESRDVIYRLNVQTGRYEYISPAAEAVVGFSVDELMAMDGEASLATIHPEDVAAMEAAGARLLATGKADLEYRQRARNGEYRWISNHMSLVKDSLGRPLYRNGNIRDITERKQADDKLRASNLQLADADRRKNDFMAVLSHELRNPLAPIRNSAYILERAAPGCDQARRAVAVIGRQAAQLARLVDDLLDVTRITQNKIQLQRQTLELNDLARHTIEDQRSLFDKAEVRLEFNPSTTPVFVNADGNRVAQVIGNLLQNAAKFTGRGGATRITITTEAAGQRAVIQVADTGVGMTPEMVSRLFLPFSQADSTLDRSKGGLGLGLALVRGLAELHGGDVTAHSAGVGQGAEFVVRLPLAMEKPATSQPGASATKSRRRILVIEDNLDVADSLRDVLTFGEHEIEVAYNGPDGIAKARKFHPEVVLCDIGMPGMDGYEVARAFRADAALNGAFLVALTGYALPEDLERAQAAGFARHIAKPPSLEKLGEILAEVP
jgi:two-component system CheB/CheR fusion protein